MTKIKISGTGNVYKILAEGHANYAENGKDIVCAAISTLLQSFTFYCMQVEETCPDTYVSCDGSDGYYSVICVSTRDLVRGAYLMTINGLESIAAQYPDYIKICT